MPVCHIFVLVLVALIVLGTATLFVNRDEHEARFKEKIEIEEDERISKTDLP